MNQIIKISPLSMGGEEVNSVNARELHEALGVKKPFTQWIEPKLKDTMLDEGVDYVSSNQKVKREVGSSIRKEYILTLDTAKHIAMMSRTAKGKEVRAYFIEVEKRAVQRASVGGGDVLMVLGQMGEAMSRVAQSVSVLAQSIERIESRVARLESPRVRVEVSGRSSCGSEGSTSYLLQLFSKLIEVNPGINQSQLMGLAGYRKDDKRVRYLLQEMDGTLWHTIRERHIIHYYPSKAI